MTDLDPSIWENKTLGAATATPFLDEVEAQRTEDFNARKGGYEPRVAVRVNRHPQLAPSGSVHSSVADEVILVDPATVDFTTNEVTPVAEDSDEELFSSEDYDHD